MSANEAFEKEISGLKAGSGTTEAPGDTSNSGLQDQCRRLQAKNVVLEKNYQGTAS